MEKIITYESLRSFAYSNDKLIKGEIKGIVLDFFGLGGMNMLSGDPGDAKEYAEKGIALVIPYTNPWCWMNQSAVAYTDEIIDTLCAKYSLPDNIKIVSSGGSMGGLSALVYTYYAKRTPVACVTNCPVCDLVYHFTEREDLPRTIYSAFAEFDGTLNEALEAHSPLHLAPKRPKIPYSIFHCEHDNAVSLEKHSARLFEAMRKEHDITLMRVPLRGHCDLSPEARIEYRRAIVKAIEE
ncbi:MAG: prolyl oligopeptidase family serine peptidase [Clostridia bacterium]|nr:prolyl oligopeptidase family serine peptidase [Clostridia bacterium]